MANQTLAHPFSAKNATRNLFASIFSILVLTLCFAFSATDARAGNGTCDITGVVSDGYTGLPVSGVYLQARQLGTSNWIAGHTRTITNSNGEYAFTVPILSAPSVTDWEVRVLHLGDKLFSFQVANGGSQFGDEIYDFSCIDPGNGDGGLLEVYWQRFEF